MTTGWTAWIQPKVSTVQARSLTVVQIYHTAIASWSSRWEAITTDTSFLSKFSPPTKCQLVPALYWYTNFMTGLPPHCIAFSSFVVFPVKILGALSWKWCSKGSYAAQACRTSKVIINCPRISLPIPVHLCLYPGHLSLFPFLCSTDLISYMKQKQIALLWQRETARSLILFRLMSSVNRKIIHKIAFLATARGISGSISTLSENFNAKKLFSKVPSRECQFYS